MQKFLRNTVDTVFIILGRACNNNCIYCMQHEFVNKNIKHEDTEINNDIIDFLAELSENRDKRTDYLMYINFFGGEPLLYYDSIKYITKELLKKTNCTFGLISNGKALTDEMVKFFNLYNFSVGISWDGYNVLKTRHYDIINDTEMRKRLLKLKNLNISSVGCSYSYPREIFDAAIPFCDEYYKKHGKYINIGIDPLYDTHLTDRSLLDIDYDKIFYQITEIVRAYLYPNEIKDDKLRHPIYKNYISPFIERVKNYVKNGGNLCKAISKCGNGFNVINLDLKGNLYPCHNMDKPCSTIYDSYIKYINNIILFDSTKEYIEECESCPIYSICYGGCPLISLNKIGRDNYCKLKKAYYYPIIEQLLNIKEEEK